jgi:hypothetical protein
LRFWPAAISSASVFTRHRRRKRKRRNPFQSLTSPLDGKQVYQAYLRRAKNRRDRYLEVYGDGWEGGYWEPIGPRFHLDLVESPS